MYIPSYRVEERERKKLILILVFVKQISQRKRENKKQLIIQSLFSCERNLTRPIYVHIYISIQVSNSLYLSNCLSNYLSTYTSFFLYFLSLHAFRLTTIRKKLFTLQNIPECHISLALIYLKLSFLPTFCTCYFILGRDCSVRKI